MVLLILAGGCWEPPTAGGLLQVVKARLVRTPLRRRQASRPPLCSARTTRIKVAVYAHSACGSSRSTALLLSTRLKVKDTSRRTWSEHRPLPALCGRQSLSGCSLQRCWWWWWRWKNRLETNAKKAAQKGQSGRFRLRFKKAANRAFRNVRKEQTANRLALRAIIRVARNRLMHILTGNGSQNCTF